MTLRSKTTAPNFILDLGGSQYASISQTKMLTAHASGLDNHVTTIPAVTAAGTYAAATLMAKWPPGSSLVII